jgi:hypothetical protein
VTHIRVNGQFVEWPKPTISEDRLRDYTDAPAETHEVFQFQESTGRVTPVRRVANLREGHIFRAAPRKENAS